MSLINDFKDPTTALFLSEREAWRAAGAAKARYPQRVDRAEPKIRRRRGEVLGYAVVVYFTDGRPVSPLTNSDIERLFP